MNTGENRKRRHEDVGVNPESDLVEIIELKNHPYFVGSQFHPEFKSRPCIRILFLSGL